MMWRCLFEDTVDVEAATEDEAKRKALAKIVLRMEPGDFVVWPTDGDGGDVSDIG